MDRRKIITAVLAALMAGAVAQADMMPPGAGGRRLPGLLPAPDGIGGSVSNRLARPALGDLDSWSRGMLSDAPTEAEGAAPIRPLYVLADREMGVSLCLYALLGLGLYKSIPGARRFALDSLPQWYYDGGPHQIGSSLVFSPACLTPAPVYGFLQPEGATEAPTPPYRREVTIALWRRSQFPPAVDAPRGPPHLC